MRDATTDGYDGFFECKNNPDHDTREYTVCDDCSERANRKRRMTNTYQLVINVREDIAGDIYRLAETIDSERVRITFSQARGDVEIVEVVSTQVKGTE